MSRQQCNPSPKPRRRRSPKVDMNADLLGYVQESPTLNGLVSFLNVKPWESSGATGDQESAPTGVQESPYTVGPDSLSTVGFIEQPIGPEIDRALAALAVSDSPYTVGQDSEPTLQQQFPNTVVSESPHTVGHDSSPTEQSYLESPPAVTLNSSSLQPESISVTRVVQFKLQRLNTVQDGHSDLENRIYEGLWHAAPEIIGRAFRELSIGYDRAARLGRTDKQNAKKAIDSLINKLSVERIGLSDSAARTGSRYRIFSYKQVIARRREAGYTAVIRNRGGVQLWRPAGSEPASGVGPDSLPTVGLELSRPTDTVDSEPPDTVDSEPPDTVGREPVVLKGLYSNKLLAAVSSSSADVDALTTELRRLIADVDDAFVRELLRRSREACPDCTVTEIGHWAAVKARFRGIRSSFTGFLLTAVPHCLTGESFRQYREAESQKIEAEREHWRTERREAEAVLNSREGKEEWEIEGAETTLNWLREYHPWLFQEEKPH